jgi:hypothetical protein
MARDGSLYDSAYTADIRFLSDRRPEECEGDLYLELVYNGGIPLDACLDDCVLSPLVPVRSRGDRYPGILHAYGGRNVVHANGPRSHLLFPAQAVEQTHLFLLARGSGHRWSSIP